MAVSLGEIRDDVLQSLREALPFFGKGVQYGTRPITGIERKCLIFAFRDNFTVTHLHLATRVPEHVLQAILDEHNAKAETPVVPDGSAGGRISPIVLPYQQQVDLCGSYERGQTVRQLASRHKSLVTKTHVTEEYVRNLLKRHGYFEKVDKSAILERRKRVWELRTAKVNLEKIARELKVCKTTVSKDWKWCQKEWGKSGPPVETTV